MDKLQTMAEIVPSTLFHWAADASLVFYPLILITLATLLLLLLSSNSKEKLLIDKIPGPPAWPILGNALLLRPDGSGFMQQIWTMTYRFNHENSRMLRIWLGHRAMILLFGADNVEKLLNSSKHMTKSRDYTFLMPWLGTGLLTSTGTKWKSRRRLLTPTFHFKILNDFLQVFNEQTGIMMDKLELLADGKRFDIFPMITLCALDIICETAMGRNVNAQNNKNSDYVQAIYELSERIQKRQKSPWLWPDLLYSFTKAGKHTEKCLKILHGFTEKVITERAEELNRFLQSSENSTSTNTDDELPSSFGEKKRLAFLDMLLYAARDGEDLDFKGIREEVDTFMFEGHDTTAAGMAWATHLLGQHPEVQKKVQEELNQVLGSEPRPITMQDIRELTYLEQVIKESLRLYPSVPLFGRTISEDCVIGGYQIPKGTTAVVVTSALHRDPAHFPQPEKFDPSRWDPDKAAGRHPYCYIPFSAGLRNCIGQRFALNEEKVILASLLHRFNVTSCDETRDLDPVGELILRPGVGVNIKLTKRNPAEN